MKIDARKTACLLLTILVLGAACLLPIQSASAQGVSVSDPRYRALNARVDSANASIAILIRVAQLTPWNDVPILLPLTERIAADAIGYAACIGLPGSVVCVYETYRIDGQTVEIDPLKVINYED